MTQDGCLSSRLVHECEGEAACGFYGLPHVLCVPVPPYARGAAGAVVVEGEPEGSEAVAPQDELARQVRRAG